MRNFLLLISFIYCFPAFSQTTWETHSSIQHPEDVGFYENKAYVCMRGGFLIIDQETGEESFYQAANSSFQGHGTGEVEVLENGHMWISGYEDGGIFYYDGERFEHFYYVNESDTIRAASNLVANQDRLWFFSHIEGNSINGKGKFISYENGLFRDNASMFPEGVDDFCLDSDNNLWLAYEGSLYQYDNENLSNAIEIPIVFTERTRVWAYLIDSEGTHWIDVYDYGSSNVSTILSYRNGIWKTNEVPVKVREFFEDSKGNISFSAGLEYGQILNDSIHIDAARNIFPEVPTSQQSLIVRGLDNNDNVWLSSWIDNSQPHLYKYNQGEVVPFAQNPGSSSLSVSSPRLVKDCDGYMHSTAGVGFQKYDGESWEKQFDLTSDCSFINTALNPITCEIWGASYNTSCPLVFTFEDGQMEERQLGDAAILDFTFDKEGNTYLANAREGLLVISADNSEMKYDLTNSPIRSSYNVHYAMDSSLWVIGLQEDYTNTLFRLKDGEWQTYTETNSPLPRSINWWQYEDNEGNLWLNNEKGLVKYDGENWSTYNLDFLDFKKGVNDMLQDVDGNYWLATYANGLLYWDGFDFVAYDIVNSDLFDNSCGELEFDGQGNLWVSHTDGITQLSIENNNRYPSVKGFVFYDEDQSQDYNPSEEITLPNQKVVLLPQQETAVTNSIGAYAFYNLSPYEDHSVFALTENTGWETTNSTDLVFNPNGEPVRDLNIGLWKELEYVQPKLDVTLSPMVCFEEVGVWVTVENVGLESLGGTLKLEVDSLFGIISSEPLSDFTDELTIVWEDINIPARQSRSFFTVLQVPGWDEVFDDPLAIDTTLIHELNREFEFKARHLGEEITESEILSTYLCAYDPNDKLVQSAGEEQDSLFLLQDALEYTIRFQNLGNYKAKNVVIKDTLDGDLDFASLELIASSHPVSLNYTRNGIVTFRFENINLPPESESALGSQGFVKYSIRAKADLVDYSSITNTATIYFDHNPGIVTNTTENLAVEAFPGSSVAIIPSSDGILVFPNPSTGAITCTTKDEQEKTYKVYTLEGRLVSKDLSAGSSWTSQLETGVYILQVSSGSGVYTERVVVTR